MTENRAGRTYKATGITLKSMPMGESDRLLTILTKEHGLVRAITPGSRKPKSSLRAISTGFVIGELFIVKGRSLDKLVQAECRKSFPGLSRDLGKLTAAQYLAELALGQALSDHPQEELFDALILHLDDIAQGAPEHTLPSLVQGILHFLAIAGIAPQVQQCCVTQAPIVPNLADSDWRVGFDASAGGAIALPERLSRNHTSASSAIHLSVDGPQSNPVLSYATEQNTGQDAGQEAIAKVAESVSPYFTNSVNTSPASSSMPPTDAINRKPIPKPILKKKAVRQIQLDAMELALLQHLSQPGRDLEHQRTHAVSLTTIKINQKDLADCALGQDTDGANISNSIWLSLERTLRYYVQYHFDKPIRSAALIETCFLESMTN
ncbi:MAG: DNA repair protein RecO [Cyanobacteria bacterium P01_F01_bin.150]